MSRLKDILQKLVLAGSEGFFRQLTTVFDPAEGHAGCNGINVDFGTDIPTQNSPCLSFLLTWILFS